jgi:hypothetical protein
MCSFPSTEKPQYKKGCTVNVAFASLGFCIMTGMTLYYRMENRRRDKIEGGRPEKGTQLETVEKFDLAPGQYKAQNTRPSTDWTGFRYVA